MDSRISVGWPKWVRPRNRKNDGWTGSGRQAPMMPFPYPYP